MADDVLPSMLDKGARVELKTLTKENADWVASHLVMAARLLDEDPELAHQHALSAARKGGRISVVRETLAITAYTVGDFALALRELRTFRRISGSNDQLPLMVDSERGVGRPDRALELGRSVPREDLPVPVQVALAIAMSGARLDLGQPELALGELEIPQLDPDHAYSYSPPLYRAYAEVLDELGRADDAAEWRARAEIAEAALEPEEDLAETDDETIEVVEIEDRSNEDGDGEDLDGGGTDDESAAAGHYGDEAGDDGTAEVAAVEDALLERESFDPGEARGMTAAVAEADGASAGDGEARTAEVRTAEDRDTELIGSDEEVLDRDAEVLAVERSVEGEPGDGRPEAGSPDTALPEAGDGSDEDAAEAR